MLVASDKLGMIVHHEELWTSKVQFFYFFYFVFGCFGLFAV